MSKYNNSYYHEANIIRSNSIISQKNKNKNKKERK